MNSFISKMKFSVMGKRQLQGLFEKLHRIALGGMHVGNGAFIEFSGELFLMQWIRRRIDSNHKPIIFDVGANSGEYTSAILENFGNECEVHCFEPSTAAFKELNERFFETENVKVNNFGLGNRVSDEILYSDSDGSTISSLYRSENSRLGVSLDHSERVPIETIDEYIVSNNIETVDLLKIDVEGHELAVLEGAVKTIGESRIFAIQFEIGPSSLFAGVYLKRFFELLPNYDIYRLLQNGLRKIHYSERYEIFLTSNYVAVITDR